MAIDPKIKERANQIRTAVLGRDVREALASGLEVMSEDVEEIKQRQDNVESQFQTVLDETTGKDVISAPEVTAARVGADGTQYSNLKQRLDSEHDKITAQLAEATYETEQARVSSDGTTYSTLKERLDTEYGELSSRLADNLTYSLKSYKSPLTQIKGQLLESPSFKKYEQNPVLTRDDCPWLKNNNWKIYWPWMVYVEPILGDKAIDKFYLYYSSDHADATGGIGLATAPHPLGPFTDRGRIYYDREEGGQTETPCVVWNEKTGKFHMYYHNWGAGRNQSSLLATSTDGLNWERYGVVVDVPDIEFPGDGHTGYMRVYRIGDLWIAHHLMGGGGTYHFGVSYSNDGFEWVTDPRPILGFGDLTDDPLNKRLEYISFHPFLFRNQVWCAFTISPYESGLNTAEKEMYVARMDSPRRFYNLQKVFGGSGWDEVALRQPHVIEFEDKLYMYYAAAGLDGNGAIGIAIGEV